MVGNDWEQSHLPLDDPRAIHPPTSKGRKPMVCCRHCMRNLPVAIAKKHDYFDGKRWQSAYFCDQGHMELWYIRQLRNTVER